MRQRGKAKLLRKLKKGLEDLFLEEQSIPNERDHCLKSKASKEDRFGKAAASIPSLIWIVG